MHSHSPVNSSQQVVTISISVNCSHHHSSTMDTSSANSKSPTDPLLHEMNVAKDQDKQQNSTTTKDQIQQSSETIDDQPEQTFAMAKDQPEENSASIKDHKEQGSTVEGKLAAAAAADPLVFHSGEWAEPFGYGWKCCDCCS